MLQIENRPLRIHKRITSPGWYTWAIQIRRPSMTKQTEVHVHTCECAICQAGTNHGTIQQHQRMNLFLSRLTEPQRRWYVGMLSQEPDSPSDVELARIT